MLYSSGAVPSKSKTAEPLSWGEAMAGREWKKVVVRVRVRPRS